MLVEYKLRSCKLCHGYDKKRSKWTVPKIYKETVRGVWVIRCQNNGCSGCVEAKYRWLAIRRWNRMDEK